MKNVATVVLIKQNGKLTPKNKLFEEQYRLFAGSVPEGAEVNALFEINNDTNTKAQLAKIHVMLKEIAVEQGMSVSETKDMIKDKCGLFSFNDEGEKTYTSFGKISKEELSYAIEVIYQVGEFMNINFKENLR